jgi:hypothetical protein
LCKICDYFKNGYRKNDEENFKKLVAENVSLRRLEIFFKALNYPVQKDTIRKHILHMETSVKEQRETEKSLKKEETKGTVNKIKDFFIRPDLPVPSKVECTHLNSRKTWNLATETVDEYCSSCGKLLGSYSPEEARSNPDRDSWLYRGLRRR